MVRSSCMKSVTELDTPGKSLCKVSMIVVFMVFKSHTNCWIIQVLRLKHTDPQMTLHPVIFCMHFSLLYWNTKKTIIGIRPESKWTVKTRTVEICCLLVVNSESCTSYEVSGKSRATPSDYSCWYFLSCSVWTLKSLASDWLWALMFACGGQGLYICRDPTE